MKTLYGCINESHSNTKKSIDIARIRMVKRMDELHQSVTIISIYETKEEAVAWYKVSLNNCNT